MSLNIDIFYFINKGLQNPIFDAVMPGLSNIGGFASLLGLCILAIIITKYFKKDKYFEIAKLSLFALVLAGIIVAGLKLTFHSPRPYTVLSNVHQLTIPSEPNSFPSGHTASTLSVITVLVWKLRENKLLVCLLVVFAFLISFSRIYVGVHFPFDVFVGAFVGVLSGLVILSLKKHLKI